MGSGTSQGSTDTWWQSFVRTCRVAWLRIVRWMRKNRPTAIVAGLLALFLVAYSWRYMVIRIDSGEAGVLYRLFGGGTVTDTIYDEGIHIIFPWNRMYVYNVRIQEEEHEVDLLTSNGLSLTFHLSIRHKPNYELLGLMHQRVGPDYVQAVVVPQVVSVLRTHVGQSTAEEVYTTKRAILQRIFSEAIEQVARKYITIDQVIIRTIKLPPLIQKAVEAKIEHRHIAESYQYRLLEAQQEAKRKVIEAEGVKSYNEIVTESLTDDILKWKGVEATRELATSENSKVIVIGNGDKDLPVILGADR